MHHKIDESSRRFLVQETFTTYMIDNKYDTDASWHHSWTIEAWNFGHEHATGFLPICQNQTEGLFKDHTKDT